MSQLRMVFSGLAQSWTKPTTVPNPPEISSTDLIRATRSSRVPIVATAPGAKAVLSTASSATVPLDTSAWPAEHPGPMRQIAVDKRLPSDIDAQPPVKFATALPAVVAGYPDDLA